MKNSIEIYEFGEHWRTSPSFIVEATGNYFFGASITYSSSTQGNEHGECSVRITRNGFGDGDINLFVQDGHWLNSDTHHLDFKSSYQQYEFDTNDSSLVVSGRSQKMGKYAVRFLPNGKDPNFGISSS